MILADEPAYDLPPISRALKFLDFDRLLARLVKQLEWNNSATDPGGYHGEIELTPVGAVPAVELEG